MIRWMVYDDPESKALRPLTTLRPASGLLLGTERTLDRWTRWAAGEEATVVCRNLLAPLEDGRVPWSEAMGRFRLGGNGVSDSFWISDLLMPDAGMLETLRESRPDSIFRNSGFLAGFHPGPGIEKILERAVEDSPEELIGRISAAGGMSQVELPGARLGGLGDLVRFQETLLARDLERLLNPARPLGPGQGTAGPTGSSGAGDGFVYRPEAVHLGTGCRIDAGAVLDAREGPVFLAEGCEVSPHTWIRGPFYAGPRCRLLGGRIGGGSSFGPECRVRGEVEASVFLGFDNKAHDGFVGHSYLGEWVNLGALTTTSDLKNNYAEIVLETEGGPKETGLRKLGVVLGDHVKTRIGCLLTCGTVVGVGASLAGEPEVPKRWIPDFSWMSGAARADQEGAQGAAGPVEYEINKFLKTAETVLGRRGLTLTPALAEAIRAVHRESRRAGEDARLAEARPYSGVASGRKRSQTGA